MWRFLVLVNNASSMTRMNSQIETNRDAYHEGQPQGIFAEYQTYSKRNLKLFGATAPVI